MFVFPTAVFLLCFATSIVCLVLLVAAYLRTRNRLLLWSALCFVFLAVNSALVVADIVVFDEIDLQIYRHTATLLALSVLLYGFIWDVE
jgi:hypothetical protein